MNITRDLRGAHVIAADKLQVCCALLIAIAALGSWPQLLTHQPATFPWFAPTALVVEALIYLSYRGTAFSALSLSLTNTIALDFLASHFAVPTWMTMLATVHLTTLVAYRHLLPLFTSVSAQIALAMTWPLTSADWLMLTVSLGAQIAATSYLTVTRRSLGIRTDEVFGFINHATQVPARFNLDVRFLEARTDIGIRTQRFLSEMARVISEVVAGAKNVDVATAEIAMSSRDLSQRTERQAGDLQRSASAIKEVSCTLTKTVDRTVLATGMAREAALCAHQGAHAIAAVSHDMSEIETYSKQITEINSLIDSIAFQTNILALNAAVEAARAGKQGRGFSVVATEVRGLAGRAADASRSIRGLIDSSSAAVVKGVASAKQAEATVSQMVDQVKRVATLLDEIKDSASAQSQTMVELSRLVQELDATTQQNAALVEQSSAATENLAQQATELRQSVAAFDVGISETSSGSPLASLAEGPDDARFVPLSERNKSVPA